MPSRYPPLPRRELEEFIHVVRRLRRECPWDRAQSHRSLRNSLIEETYEVIDALDRRNLADLRGELGDLMLHVIMQATIAEQAGEFTLRQVLRDITSKLIRRHPHVFGSARARNAAEVKLAWERLKLREGRSSVLDGIPRHMPSLQRAIRVQQRAAKVGFDWKRSEEVWNKVREELEELRRSLKRGSRREREEEFGDLLFALVNYARFLDVHPEDALRETIEKFIRRFRYIERALTRQGRTVHEASLEEMDALWNRAKTLRLTRRPRRPKGSLSRPGGR